ncbi:hypothetical protein PLICBS_003204 [Purpureocillium lilacinum]|nr:hypothetical protein PLICBS_003204 [Purpureocillium lilacinum]
MALDKINSGVKQVAPRAANREACVDGGGLTQLLAEQKAEKERAAARRRSQEEVSANYLAFYGFRPHPAFFLETYWMESG